MLGPIRRLLARMSRNRLRDELAEEMAWHRERLARDFAARGLSAREAADAASRQFGNSTRLEEEVFDMWQLGSLDLLAQDVKFGFRTLRRSPGFTLVALLILAIGIGATTAIFSAVQTMLLRPLPFREPETLMQVSMTRKSKDGSPPRDGMIWSWPKAQTFARLQPAYADLGLWTWEQLTINTGEPEREYGETVSARYLATLGVRPALGADFPLEVDARPNPVPVALISDDLWKRRFNADPKVLGQTIDLDRVPYTIVGVLPLGFHGLSGRANLWTPILARRPSVFEEAFDHEFYMVGRLKGGTAPAQAAAAAAVVGDQVNAAFPDRFGAGMGASARSLDQTRVDPRVRRSLLILLGAVTFVLLIACANIANLFLVRANGRAREIALRLAVGAPRVRVVRQLLTESALLAVAGGVAGLAVAWWGVRLLGALNPARALGVQQLEGLGVVSFATIRLDPATFSFAAAVTILTGLLFGLVPALRATGVRLGSALKEGSAQSGSGAVRRGGGVLVIAEVALAIVLLAGSGLMIRSLANRLGVNPGFDAEQVLTLRLSFAPGQSSRDSLPFFYDRLLERLRALPGVTDAALGNCPPLAGGCNGTIIWFRDKPPVRQGTEPDVGVQWITPGWTAALRVPLVRGRLFTAGDRLGAPKVVLVNATAAHQFWPDEDPIGKRVGVGQGGFGDTVTVIGVIGDVQFGTLDSVARADVFIPYYQSPRGQMMVFLRTGGDPLMLAGSVHAAIRGLAPDLPVYDVRPLTSRVADASAQSRFSAVLLALFAAMALVLASLGIYGVMSYVVAQRTREIGIRVALGAVRQDVLGMVIRQGVTLAVVGGGFGLVAALLTTRVLRSLLYDVAPTDPGTYAAIVVLIVGAALIASWIPARRATRIHPMEALRSE